MRKIIALIILVAGYVFLGLIGMGQLLPGWDFGKTTSEIEAYITKNASDAVSDTTHDVNTEVSGRDIVVSGIAANADEKQQILASLDALQGRRVVHDDLDILQIASPYEFNATKDNSGITYSGHSPMADTFDPSIGSTLSLAAGMPDDAWVDVANRGQRALSTLENGKFTLSDRTITLSGHAKTIQDNDATRAVLNNLPDGYSAAFDITTTPTTPYVFEGRKTPDTKSYAGYIPNDSAAEDFRSLLGNDPTADITLEAHHGMPDENWPLMVNKGATALSQLTVGNFKLIDTTLMLSGEAANPTIANTIKDQIATLPEGYNVVLDLTVKKVDVYTFNAHKKGEELQIDGYVPSDEQREKFRAVMGDKVQSLKLGAGMPDEEWPGFVTRAMDAFSHLENGDLAIADRHLEISGSVENPAAADLVAQKIGVVPAGYDVDLRLTALDDGRPAEITLDYSNETGGRISGKAPAGLNEQIIASALGMPELEGGILPSRLEGGDVSRAQLKNIGRWIPSFQKAMIHVSPDSSSIEATLLPGKACTQKDILSDMKEALGPTAAISLAISPDEPNDGTIRTNDITGKSEVYKNCFWLPSEQKPDVIPPIIVEVDPDASQETDSTTQDASNGDEAGAVEDDATPSQPASENDESADSLADELAAIRTGCKNNTTRIMAENKINFISGKAELDPSSLVLIDELSKILKPCVGADFELIVGGHTDSIGSAEFNAQLSLERASAVVGALVDRGVDANGIIAKGYGESTPIASNETESGRALNRRTTFAWKEN